MSIVRFACSLALLTFALLTNSIAQPSTESNESSKEDAEKTHAQLRELRDRMFASYQKRDVDALLADCTPNIVITWQNGMRNEGHQAFRDFYAKMMEGNNAIVKDISTKFAVDDSSILYGQDSAVARGTADDKFVLSNGSEFLLNSKWTATLVKVQDSWKVASFHISASIFDNPILMTARNSLITAAIASAIGGLVVGLIIGRLVRKKAS